MRTVRFGARRAQINRAGDVLERQLLDDGIRVRWGEGSGHSVDVSARVRVRVRVEDSANVRSGLGICEGRIVLTSVQG